MPSTGTGRNRPDKQPGRRMQYERNRKKILASQDICGICGKPVDKSLKYPDPLSPTIDHIIPVSRGGDPVDLDNLQLAHFCCNVQKSSRLGLRQKPQHNNTQSSVNNRDLPLSYDWIHYRATDD